MFEKSVKRDDALLTRVYPNEPLRLNEYTCLRKVLNEMTL